VTSAQAPDKNPGGRGHLEAHRGQPPLVQVGILMYAFQGIG
jgi:hypothetical protein